MTTQGHRTIQNLSGEALEAIQKLDESVEEHNCALYVMRLFEGKTKKDIYTEMGISDEGLRQRAMRWAESGLLEKVRRVLLFHRREEIQIQIDQLLDNEIYRIDELEHLSLHAKREDVRLNAIMYIREEYIKPELAKVVAEDDAATRYAKEGDVFDPTDIKPPTFLTAGKVIKNARKKDVQ